MTNWNSRQLEAVFEVLVKHTPKNGCGVVSHGFWDAIDPMDYRERDQALALLNEQNLIDIFPQGEGERPIIAVRPSRVRCSDCRQWHSGCEDWDEHFDACQKQQEKLRERGLLYRWNLAEPKGGRDV